jgi:tetratricopeptide (TPR) repeat protein/DNA-binding XRE family transcriptional regulator
MTRLAPSSPSDGYTLVPSDDAIQECSRQFPGNFQEDPAAMTNSVPPEGSAAPTLAGLLRARRERALLTRAELAERSGLSERTIVGLETGRVQRPRIESVRLLADALGLAGQEREAFVAAARGTEPVPVPAGAVSGGPVPNLPVVPAQLPADPAGFVGRARYLWDLDALLPGEGRTSPGVVVVTGTGGVGKTALAIHWAHQVRAHFPDGQLYVNLRGYAPTAPMRPVEVLAYFLHGLGVAAEQVPVEIEEAAALYRTLLADKRVLVVLDNARDAEQVRPLLPGSKGCLVVATSRDRLAGLVATHGAHRLGLDVLAPEEAVLLLARILGEERVAAEPEATAAVAEVCGFLPLALRIAAANLLDRPQPSIADYVGRLRAGNRLGELAVDGDPQAAVGVAFDASYATLDPQARRLFRLLGLVPGPDVTAPAAAALTGMQVPEVEQLLERLAGAHLAEPRGGGRYGLHDLLRLYARQRTEAENSEPERQAALGRLLSWYLHSADGATQLLYPNVVRLPLPPATSQMPLPAFSDHAQALAWLDAERSNLVAAVQQAAEHGPRPAAWLLADALHGYLWQGMHVVDWSVVAEAALAAAHAEGGPRPQSAARVSLADLNLCLSRYRQAIEHYARALALNQQTGWLEAQAATLSKLGVAYARSGRLAEAADHHHQALTLNQRIGRLGGQATNLGNLGVVYLEQGRLQAAVAQHAQALALFGKLGYRGSQGTALGWLGEIEHALGRLDRAVDHANAALAIQREVGDRGGEADTLRTLAGIARDTGRLGYALELATTAVALAGATGERRLQADALNTLASVHLHRGSLPQARYSYGQALELARATESRYPEVVTLLGLATTDQRAGRHDQALVVTNQALTLARQAGFRLLEGQALTTLAGIQLAQDQPDQAVESARQALAIQRDTGHRLGQAHTLLVLGHALHPQGADAALPHWQQALALFTEIGTPEANHAHALVRTCATAVHRR